MFDWIDGDDYDKSVRERFAEDPNLVDWEIISCSYRLSEKFMREFKDYLNWKFIQKYGGEYLSDDFIREFRDEFPTVILWEELTQEQKLRTLEICKQQKQKKVSNDLY